MGYTFIAFEALFGLWTLRAGIKLGVYHWGRLSCMILWMGGLLGLGSRGWTYDYQGGSVRAQDTHGMDV